MHLKFIQSSPLFFLNLTRDWTSSFSTPTATILFLSHLPAERVAAIFATRCKGHLQPRTRNGHEEIVLVNSYRELVLEVGETVTIGNRRLTLLDTEGELGLFQLDADNEYCPISGEEVFELLATTLDGPDLPR